MFRLLVIVAFILALATGAVANTPLSFAMRLSGVADRGLSWQQARGTIWNGQLSGLASSGVDLGTARIKSHPTSLLAGTPSATLQMSAGAVQGTLNSSVAGKNISVNDVSINADLAQLSNLKPELRRTGGTLSVRNANFSVGQDGTCIAASGTANLDTVRRIGILYGRDWPLLAGDLSCDSGAFLIKLSGTGPAQETFDLTVRFLQAGTTQIKVQAANLDPEAAQLLPALGFSKTPEGLVFYQDTSRPN
jgi:hypothetical protein